MGMRRDALGWADAALWNAVQRVRGLIADAIELRRLHPHRYALFHRRMAYLIRASGRSLGIGWHEFWARRYEARAWALDNEIASACVLSKVEGMV